jgi:hypothetical protein
MFSRGIPMINPISSAPPVQHVADSTKVNYKPPQSPTAPLSPGHDSFKLSSIAQAYAATLQEARETPTQTAQEAQKGDLQARHLLARQATVKPATK